MCLTQEIFQKPGVAGSHVCYLSPEPTTNNRPRVSESLGKRKRGSSKEERTSNTTTLKTIKLVSGTPALQHDESAFERVACTTADNWYLRPEYLLARPPRHSSLQQQQHLSTTSYKAPNHGPPAPTAAGAAPANAQSKDRCHICSRAPLKKTDLEKYVGCSACGKRTCHICMRVCRQALACEPDDDDGRKICRMCCVEIGPEGDAWCLDCRVVEEGQVGAASQKEQVMEGMAMS